MSCYCLCRANHPQYPNICNGEATGVIRFREFPKDSVLADTEYVDVHMCDPCREKTLEYKGQIDGRASKPP